MTGLRPALAGYLDLRRSLGFKLDRDARLLDQFITCLEQRGTGTVTVTDALFQVGDELIQQLGVAVQLEPQSAAQVQVAGQRRAQPGHDEAPGHGRASERSASMLTLVYAAVVAGRRCRSTWPISASDPPPASMAVAALCRSRCA